CISCFYKGVGCGIVKFSALEVKAIALHATDDEHLAIKQQSRGLGGTRTQHISVLYQPCLIRNKWRGLAGVVCGRPGELREDYKNCQKNDDTECEQKEKHRAFLHRYGTPCMKRHQYSGKV